MVRVYKKCEHGRRKCLCIPCGGKGICQHGKLKTRCITCGGGSMCQHGKRRTMCIDCGGKGICQHGKPKTRCISCGGSSICQHGKLKVLCITCGGGSICQHGKRKSHCILCGSSAYCQHGKRKTRCISCGGDKICQHKRIKLCCAECHNFICNIADCTIFGHKFSSARNLQRHMQNAHTSNPKALTKRRELDIHMALQKAGVSFDYQHRIPFAACGFSSETKYAILDFTVSTSWGTIVLEVDEHQHANYPSACDVRRDFDIAASVALGSAQKLVVLRYNPDSFRVAGKNFPVAQKVRIDRLIEVIHNMPEPQGFKRFFLFYDMESETAALPIVAKEWEENVREVSEALPVVSPSS